MDVKTKICPICNNKFYRRQKKYCSRKCFKIFLSMFWKGRIFSEETRKKISLAKMNHLVSKETRKRISLLKKGHRLSNETRKKMSESKIGHFVSDETKRKISISNTGKHPSKETRIKISLSNMQRCGDKHPNWRGGISFEPYGIEFNEILKEKIRERDKICQLCGNKKSESVHHMDYNKRNNQEDNLILLCRSCHTKTNYNREWWIDYWRQKKCL